MMLSFVRRGALGLLLAAAPQVLLSQATTGTIRGRVTDAGTGQGIAPPLQADFTGQRLVRNLADPRNLEVESVEREPIWPTIGRGEQGRHKTIPVGRPHQRLAMRVSVIAHILGAHGTAISNAATRRRSPSRML